MSIVRGEVFEIGGGGLRRITTDEFDIGQPVKQADAGFGFVVDKDQYGYIVIEEDGRMHTGQTVGSNSPYTRITKAEGEMASAEKIEELKQKYTTRQNQQAENRKQEAHQHAIDYEKFVKQLKLEYPNAVVHNDKLSEAARAAKNLKQELTTAFPGHKFSVKSDQYAGGNAIRVSWDFGPTKDEYEKIANKYGSKSFDGMIDLESNDSSAYGSAVSHVLGRAGYVTDSRHYGDLYDKVKKDLCESRLDIDIDSYEADRETHRLFNRTTFPVNFTYTGVRYNNQKNETEITFDTPDVETKSIHTPSVEAVSGTEGLTSSGDSVTGTQNIEADKGLRVVERREKEGVELYFDSRPSEKVLNLLKGSGFRPGKREGAWFWWRRDSAETRALIEKIREEL